MEWIDRRAWPLREATHDCVLGRQQVSFQKMEKGYLLMCSAMRERSIWGTYSRFSLKFVK